MIKTLYDELMKVVFIDDEKLVRKLLMNCVDWNSLGYMIAGESSGGQHALNMISEVKPDLIFIDICMPIIDGIQMSSCIMKMLPDSRVVIITGHQEFEYARESIKVGVYDYLLKPINPNEISETAEKVKEEIRLRKEERQRFNELRNKLENNYPRLREQFMFQFIQGDIKGERQSLDYFDIVFDEPYFQVAVASIDFEDGLGNLTSNDIGNVFLRRLSAYERAYFFNYEELYIILNNNKGSDLSKALQFIRNELYARFACNLSAGISNPYESVSDVSNAYIQAKEALNYKIICGTGRTIKYSDLLNDDKDTYEHGNQIELLKFYMKSGLVKNAKDAVDKALDELSADSTGKTELLHAAGAKVLSACLSVMSECNMPESEILGKDGNTFEKIFNMETLLQMKRYFRQFVNDISNKIYDMNKNNTHGVVQSIRKYVEDNISDSDLSLSGVAARFYMNPSYLSRIYKLETGTTFIDDINKIRIDIVMRMLNEDDIRVYELCERIGIEDPHYLSILFKKHSGMTISEYKHMLKAQAKKK